MGSVINRGTRARPNWYLKYKDVDGRWRWLPSKQPTKAQAKKLLSEVEARVAAGQVGVEKRTKSALRCEELMNRWLDGLRNRNAEDDRYRCRRHLLPKFRTTPVGDITLSVVMEWIDDQQAKKDLSDASIRHNLNLLSRFFSWLIERGYAEVNPVRQIPTGKRPRAARKKAIPWLADDTLVVRLIRELPEPINLMFYLGNRSGLRTGEISGLRLSDLGFLGEGVIRVRYSYDGPLKEDKNNDGKVKWAPAAARCAELMAPWLANRKAAGAGSEDLVFPGPKFPERPCRALWIERRWNRVKGKLGLDLTWYQATRHSFASRNMAKGASLDEVSDALGHSSPVVTRRYYDHFVRRSYSDRLRDDLDFAPAEDRADGDVDE